MELGTYWPFGKPTRWYESRPNYSLFLLQSELDALLTEQPAKKRPLPKAKMPELGQLCANLTIFRTVRPSSKQYATCQNFVSSRSRMLFFARWRGKRPATLGANRGDNRNGIRDVKFRPLQLPIF